VSLSNFILKQVIKQEEFGHRSQTSAISCRLSAIRFQISVFGYWNFNLS